MNKNQSNRALTRAGLISVIGLIFMTFVFVIQHQKEIKISDEFRKDSIDLVKKILDSEAANKNENISIITRNRRDLIDTMLKSENQPLSDSSKSKQTDYLEMTNQENYEENLIYTEIDKDSLSISNRSDRIDVTKETLGNEKVDMTPECIANDVAQAVRDVNEYCNLIDYTPYLTQFKTLELYKEINPNIDHQTIYDFPKLYDNFTIFYNATIKQAKEHSKSWRTDGGVYVAIASAFQAAKKCATTFYFRSENVRNIMKELNSRLTDAISLIKSLFKDKEGPFAEMCFENAKEKVYKETNKDQQKTLIEFLMSIKEEVVEVLSKSQKARDQLDGFRDNLLKDSGKFTEVSENVLSLKESYKIENRHLRKNLLTHVQRVRAEIAKLSSRSFDVDVMDKKLEDVENKLSQFSFTKSKALRVRRGAGVVIGIIGSLIGGFIIKDVRDGNKRVRQRKEEKKQRIRVLREKNKELQILGTKFYGTYLIIERMENRHLTLKDISEKTVIMINAISKAIHGVESITKKFQSINTHLDRTIESADKIKNNAERENFYEDTVSNMESEWGKAYIKLLNFENYVTNSTILSCENDDLDDLTTSLNSTELYSNQTTTLLPNDVHDTITNNTVNLSDFNSTKT